jgi:hypothetical protein
MQSFLATAVVALGALAWLGCSRTVPSGQGHDGAAENAPLDASVSHGEAPTDASVAADAADAAGDAGPQSTTTRDARETFANAKLLSGRLVGHTSVVVKVKLEGGLVAAWKPSTRRGKERYRGEVAARRLALALGLPNVPEACLRSFSKAELARGLDADAAALVAQEAIGEPNGSIPGALMPWIADLQFPALEREPLLSQWKTALLGTNKASTTEDPRRAEATARFLGELSTLVAFDTISGNWDRFSGANIGKDPTSGQLLFIDNDGAFYETPPPDGLARNLRLLAGTKRFSRTFVAAMKAFDPTRLEAVFGEDLSGHPLLSPKAVAGVRSRIELVRSALESTSTEGRNAFP